MKAIKLTTAESEAVERAYYEASSFEALMAVLCRQLNADANPETAKVIRHYAELCRAAQMKLKMVQEMVISRYLDHQTSAGVQYRFDFVREEVVLLEATPHFQQNLRGLINIGMIEADAFSHLGGRFQIEIVKSIDMQTLHGFRMLFGDFLNLSTAIRSGEHVEITRGPVH